MPPVCCCPALMTNFAFGPIEFGTIVVVGTPGRVDTPAGMDVAPCGNEIMVGYLDTGTCSRLPLVGLIIVVVTTVDGALTPGAERTLIGPVTTLGTPPWTVMFPGGSATPWLI